MSRAVRVIGLGRAGGSFVTAIGRVGWAVDGRAGRGDDHRDAAADVDLVLICTPDAVIAEVASRIEPGRAVVAHVAGSLGLEVLGTRHRAAAIHPLISLPDPVVGAERLVDHGWFAIAGDPIVAELVAALGGRSFGVDDDDRAVYHAAACIAANHVVALLGQVERLAERIGVPRQAYLALADAAVDNVRRLGAARALTGPAARGDDETIDRHLDRLPPAERASYAAMVNEARRLAASGGLGGEGR